MRLAVRSSSGYEPCATIPDRGLVVVVMSGGGLNNAPQGCVCRQRERERSVLVVGEKCSNVTDIRSGHVGTQMFPAFSDRPPQLAIRTIECSRNIWLLSRR